MTKAELIKSNNALKSHLSRVIRERDRYKGELAEAEVMIEEYRDARGIYFCPSCSGNTPEYGEYCPLCKER